MEWIENEIWNKERYQEYQNYLKSIKDEDRKSVV